MGAYYTTPEMADLSGEQSECRDPARRRRYGDTDDSEDEFSDSLDSAPAHKGYQRGANMSDQDLIGFDDGPVPQVGINGKAAVNGSSVQISKMELEMNSINTKKTIQDGKHEASQNGTVTVGHSNGSHDESSTSNNGHAENGSVEEQTTIGNEDLDHVYSEVPEKENCEDNIYEEVLPVSARNDVEPSKVNPERHNESGSPLYDDSSLSSELSAELLSPLSNAEDMNGSATSDPECDAVLASEPTSDDQSLLVKEEGMKNAADVNEAMLGDELTPRVEEHLVNLEPQDEGIETATSISEPAVSIVAEEELEPHSYANVDVFVDCNGAADDADAFEEHFVDAHQSIVELTEEPMGDAPNIEVLTPVKVESAKKDHPQLKAARTETIIDKEIRTQREREEMIARERRQAQEAMKRSVNLEKEMVTAAQLTKIPITTTRQTSLSSAGSLPTTPLGMPSPAPLPAPVEKNYNCPSDSRIAEEIRELKEREEELKELRERLQTEGELMARSTAHQSPCKAGETDVTNGSTSPPSSAGLSTTLSVESVQNGQACTGLLFGPRRKDRITVKPLSDGPDATSPAVYSPPNGESPIEREIRMARDREEALRREKLLLGQLQAEGFITKSETSTAITKSLPSKTPAAHVAPGSAQKLLATSRIQQEIEEQTQREIDLRASGHIQTISQERTDSKVTGIGSALVTGRQEEATVKSSTQQPAFLANDFSIPNVEIYEKSPAVKKPPTPTPTGKSPVSVATGPTKNGSVPRAVSMQKFIASRGKELVFTQPQNGSCGSERSASLEYCELKPPQVRRGSGVDRKGFVTAETKIQEEMRAMKEREEELKRQRSRLLGQSQPNLSTLESGNGASADAMTSSLGNVSLCDQAGEKSEVPEDSLVAGCPEVNNAGGPRRRSALIEQWEQRIQKTDVIKT